MIFSGFWPKFSKNRKDSLSASWLEAAGFKHYLQSVFKKRLDSEHIHMQDGQTIRLYTSYLIAFRLVDLDSDYLRAIVRSQKSIG